MLVGLTLVVGSLASGRARADAAPPSRGPLAWLAAHPELQRFKRIAVTAGDPSADSGRARDAAARVLASAGRDVATLLTGTEAIGDRESRAAVCRGFDALAVVKNSTAGDRPALTLTLYNPHGDLVAELTGPGLPAEAWPRAELPARRAAGAPPSEPRLNVDSGSLRGPLLYEAAGRPDLASRYRRGRAAKIAVMSAGGGVAVAGLVLTLGDFLVTDLDNSLRCWTLGSALDLTSAPPCQRDEANPWPFVTMIGVGMAAAMVGAMIQVDPLTPTERRALELQIGAAPAAHGDGGSVLLRGRF